MPVIQTHDLVKRYGAVEALKGVTVTVEKGEIFGMLGQNGAGKTTLIKLLLGITRPTEGSATLLGEPVGSAAARRRVGYLPEDHRFPDYHTGYSLLEYYGALLGVPRSERRQRIPARLEQVGLKGRMHSKIRTYSKGMKQRLGIAQAIFHDPDVIFLDEPTDGVDPIGRREIRAMLEELKKEGKTIFVNSHLLGEVEQISSRVVILQSGEVVRQGDLATLLKCRNIFVIGLAEGQVLPRQEIEKMGYDVSFDKLHWEIGLLDDKQTIDPVVDLLRGRGLSIRHLVEKRMSLEDLFMQTVEAAEPGVDAAAKRH